MIFNNNQEIIILGCLVLKKFKKKAKYRLGESSLSSRIHCTIRPHSFVRQLGRRDLFRRQCELCTGYGVARMRFHRVAFCPGSRSGMQSA